MQSAELMQSSLIIPSFYHPVMQTSLKNLPPSLELCFEDGEGMSKSDLAKYP